MTNNNDKRTMTITMTNKQQTNKQQVMTTISSTMTARIKTNKQQTNKQ